MWLDYSFCCEKKQKSNKNPIFFSCHSRTKESGGESTGNYKFPLSWIHTFGSFFKACATAWFKHKSWYQGNRLFLVLSGKRIAFYPKQNVVSIPITHSNYSVLFTLNTLCIEQLESVLSKAQAFSLTPKLCSRGFEKVFGKSNLIDYGI